MLIRKRIFYLINTIIHHLYSYIQIYQTTLQAALEVWLKKGIAEAQLKLSEKQIELLEKILLENIPYQENH